MTGMWGRVRGRGRGESGRLRCKEVFSFLGFEVVEGALFYWILEKKGGRKGEILWENTTNICSSDNICPGIFVFGLFVFVAYLKKSSRARQYQKVRIGSIVRMEIVMNGNRILTYTLPPAF